MAYILAVRQRESYRAALREYRDVGLLYSRSARHRGMVAGTCLGVRGREVEARVHVTKSHPAGTRKDHSAERTFPKA